MEAQVFKEVEQLGKVSCREARIPLVALNKLESDLARTRALRRQLGLLTVLNKYPRIKTKLKSAE